MREPVVLITGGSRGIGAAAVRAYARAGYRVALNYNTSAALQKPWKRSPPAGCWRCRPTWPTPPR